MKRLFLFCGIIWLLLFVSSLYIVCIARAETSDPGWYEIGRTLAYGVFAWLFLFRPGKEKIDFR